MYIVFMNLYFYRNEINFFEFQKQNGLFIQCNKYSKVGLLFMGIFMNVY